MQSVTIFGGAGFIGRYVVRPLAARGLRLQLASRNTEKANGLKPLGDVGQITVLPCDVNDPAAVRAAIGDADTVINLTGLLHETGRHSTFEKTHVDGARIIAQACKEQGVARLIHVSALGADINARSRYARTKGRGELEIKKIFPRAVIVRPSLVFGAEDQFFNRFAQMAMLSPVLPLIGGGRTRVQPVHVQDVATAIVHLVDHYDRHAGATFELGGSAVYTIRDLMEILLRVIGRRRLLLPVPFWLAKLKAFFLERLPKKLLTRDQVEMLAHDTVVRPAASGFKDLGLTPAPLESILPTYLYRFRPNGRWAPSQHS